MSDDLWRYESRYSKDEGQRARKLIHVGSVKLIQCTAYGRGKVQMDYDSKKTKMIKYGKNVEGSSEIKV